MQGLRHHKKVPHCTACVKYYCFVQGAGRRSSSFKLSCNLFGIIPVVNSTGGTVQAVCSCHILISSSVKSVYFWRFSVLLLRRFWLLAVATSINYAALTVFIKYKYVRSIVMDSSVSYYRPVTVQFTVAVLCHGLWPILIKRRLWSQCHCDRPQFIANPWWTDWPLECDDGRNRLRWCTACVGCMLNGFWFLSAFCADIIIIIIITSFSLIRLTIYSGLWVMYVYRCFQSYTTQFFVIVYYLAAEIYLKYRSS